MAEQPTDASKQVHLVAQLQKWARFPAEQVESGIRTYLEKDCASQGKKEEYLLGIIRNLNQQKTVDQNKEEPAFRSTGSPLLDEAMRNPDKWRPVDQ